MKLAKKSIITAAGWLVGLLFLIPYIRMLTTSLTPSDELYAIPAEYFPTKLEFLTSLLSGIQHQLPPT